MSVLIVILFGVLIFLVVLKNRQHIKNISRQNKFEIGSAQSIGTRQIQQDVLSVKMKNDSILLSIADGLSQNGHVAANLAINTFENLFAESNSDKPQYFFKRAANSANQKIVNVLEERQGETSIASVLIRKSEMFYTLVGNCKIAIFRDGDLIPVSEGQTIDVLARHKYDEGSISKQTTLALLNERRRYNVLGSDYFQDVELFSKPLILQSGDLVVLMTEGITNVLRWIDLENILNRSETAANLAIEIIKMIDRSQYADKDNASILIYRHG